MRPRSSNVNGWSRSRKAGRADLVLFGPRARRLYKRLSGHDLDAVFVQHEKQRKLKLARNVSHPGGIRMVTKKMSGKGTVYVREKGGLAHVGIAQ